MNDINDYIQELASKENEYKDLSNKKINLIYISKVGFLADYYIKKDFKKVKDIIFDIVVLTVSKCLKTEGNIKYLNTVNPKSLSCNLDEILQDSISFFIEESYGLEEMYAICNLIGLDLTNILKGKIK